MAWLTVIGPAVAQVEYRLEASAGCGLHQGGEHAAGQAAGHDRAHAQVDYRMDDANRLTWFGGGLADVGIEAGRALEGEADKERARALMDGTHPGTGERLVEPKRAAHPAGKLPASPLWAALEKAAAEFGMDVTGLGRTRWAAARLARLGRMVERDGQAHRVRVKDLERLVREIAGDAGVRLEAVYEVGELENARAHRDHTVRVGDRGFDLTIDIPKSPSVVWALGDPDTAEMLQTAFRRAVGETLADVERWCAYGMRGQHGDGKTAARIDTSGLLGWVMWHDVARPVHGQAPDPHLHAHAVIAHMVKGADGRWSTPGNGGREFHRHVQTAGALAQARFRRLTTEMGFRWERTPGSRVWELAGVPAKARETFSKRAAQTNAKLGDLGIDPQHATTAQSKVASALCREGKDTAPRPSANASPSTAAAAHDGDLRAAWRAEAVAERLDPDAIVTAARNGGPGEPGIGPGPDGPTPPPPAPGRLTREEEREEMTRRIAAAVFDPQRGLTAASKVATEPRVLAAVLDELADGVADFAEAERLAAAVTALPDGPAVPLPPAGGRERGPSFQTHPARFTSRDIVDAERTALALTERGLAPGDGEGLAIVNGDIAAMAVGAFEAAKGFALSAEQRAVVERLTGGGHGVDAVIGVAGSGKTTLMAAARSAWNAAGYTVRGATTAAAAAQQLAAESAIPAQTIASLLLSIDDPGKAGLQGTDVLVIDEAAMVDDRELARLLAAAADAGTKVVLIGDPIQLRAIGVGGCFAAIHQAVDGLTLTENRRQRDRLERAALQAWRDGDRDGALRQWADAGRVHAGDDRDDTLAALLTDWAATRAAGTFADAHDELNELLVLAGTNADVDALNTGARAIRRELGELTGPDRVYRLAGGRVLALAEGDHVRIRRNDYRTRRRDAGPEDVDVLNGYRGIVTGFGGRGGRDPIVEWRRDGADGPVIETATLTAAQVARGDLSCGTAMTVAAAQGQTADRTLVYGLGLDPHALYPALSRDRHRVDLYLPRALLESDADRATNGDPTGPADELTRAITAYARTLAGGPDRLITPELADHPRQDAAGHRPEEKVVPHWSRRPYGAYTDAELRRLTDAYTRELAHHRRHAQVLAAEEEAARRGQGPAAARLAERRQLLRTAAAAEAQIARLDTVIAQTWTDDRAATERIAHLQRQLQRNPLTLRLSGTTRTRLREDLAAAEADLAQAIAQRQAAEQQQREFRAAASAPYRPGATGTARTHQNPATELADLTGRWDEHLTAAVRTDLATASERADEAVHSRARIAALHSATYTRTADQARTRLAAVTTEITTRQTLPPDHAVTETTERAAHHAAQQAARHRRERDHLHGGPYRGPHPHGPSRGHDLSR